MSEPDIRQEDAFDIGAVHEALRAATPDLPAEPPRVRQLHGGASNRTYALDYPGRGLVLRRPPPGEHVGTAHDMRREHDLLAALAPAYPKAPAPVLLGDASIIGQTFFVMERIDGTILRRDLPEGLELGEEGADRLCRVLLDGLLELHRVPVQGPLARLGRGAGYVQRQVEGWTRRYRAAKTPDAASFEGVIAWLEAHCPRQVAEVLVHNDYRFDNLVLDAGDPTVVRGVLDWELATIGDPLMELGNSLAYWVQADDDPIMQMIRRQPSHLPGMWTRRRLVDAYFDASGYTATDFRFYEVMGLFRLAAIAQQIYRRYHQGVSTNPRFANFIHGVNYFQQRCLGIIGAT